MTNLNDFNLSHKQHQYDYFFELVFRDTWQNQPIKQQTKNLPSGQPCLHDLMMNPIYKKDLLRPFYTNTYLLRMFGKSK